MQRIVFLMILTYRNNWQALIVIRAFFSNIFLKYVHSMTKLLLALSLLICSKIFSQSISGTLKDATTHNPIAFANIGVKNGNTGTVSDIEGRFSLDLSLLNVGDTLTISMIGYEPLNLGIESIMHGRDKEFFIKQKTYNLSEVIIRPKEYKERILGVSGRFKRILAGFEHNRLGYEMGILMKVKKKAKIKKLNLKIAQCSYDTIFYRVNIYRVKGKMNFENILREPIYIELPKSLVKEEIIVNLESKNIWVEGDFLVTLEHVKDLGEGFLFFRASLSDKTYFRKTSHGGWESTPVGVSISVVADVEK